RRLDFATATAHQIPWGETADLKGQLPEKHFDKLGQGSRNKSRRCD
ncbi:MAG: hypothetical protein ACI85K_002487, partial [Hyphomicrobiaceae bacterium]